MIPILSKLKVIKEQGRVYLKALRKRQPQGILFKVRGLNPRS